MQMERMHAKLGQCDAAQSEAAVQKNKLQAQLDNVQSVHVQQNSELHAIVQESQSALIHLRGEKARAYHKATLTTFSGDMTSSQDWELTYRSSSFNDAEISIMPLHKLRRDWHVLPH